MIEEITREIIGIAQQTRWTEIIKFIEVLIKKTLKKGSEYSLVVINALVNNHKEAEFSHVISNFKDSAVLYEISSFELLSLYQYTEFTTTHINITNHDGVIIVIAKYFGPDLDHPKYFDFSIHLDGISDPFFTSRTGEKIQLINLIDLINNQKTQLTRTHKGNPKTTQGKSQEKESYKKKPSKIVNLEAQIYENLSDKNAVWSGSETKQFKLWKKKAIKEFKELTGRNPYYGRELTQDYENFLLNRPEIKIFERITRKNAYWNGNETKQFKQWKNRIIKQYKEKSIHKSHTNEEKVLVSKDFYLFLNAL